MHKILLQTLSIVLYYNTSIIILENLRKIKQQNASNSDQQTHPRAASHLRDIIPHVEELIIEQEKYWT